MTAPTSLVLNHIVRLFPLDEQAEVTRLLQEDCGAALPGTDTAFAESFERVQCAALKLREGRIDRLYDAIALA